jgi:CyaY protein
MDERDYQQLADAALRDIEARLEAADIDFEIAAGGILEVDLGDGGQIIVNKQAAAREIWVAARSGGFHYRWTGSGWIDTRSGEELHGAIDRLAGVPGKIPGQS